ncbi:MAG: hypothetical protein NUW00_02040 [Candidatus Kaiserbacteria bacterium]|nr:hypothetical protein [Candidatus Kaiserbacteria bacterium]
MNTQQVGGCLIVCSWQPGADCKTFKWPMFWNEVCSSVLDVLSAQRSPVQKVLILTRCAKTEERNQDVEVGEWVILPGENPPEHILTPTSKAVVENLKTLVDKGRVLWLNVASETDDEAFDRAVAFARNQGCHSVIVPHGVPIPSDMVKLGILFKKAKEVGLSLLCTFPYPRTMETVG